MRSTLKQKGFTIIEMLVVLTISAILIAVVIFNYRDADSTLIMRNLAYEVSLTVRQAQTYGLGVKDAQVENSAFEHAYGVQFNGPESSIYNDTFYLFSDIYNSNADKEFICNDSDSSSPCTSVASEEVIDALSLTRQITIDSICGDPLAGGAEVCLEDAGDTLNIAYLRPNPDAIITADVGGSATVLADVTITLIAQNDSRINVYVNAAGQISVQEYVAP